MIRLINFAFIIIFLNISISRAEIIKKIEITGNNRFSEETIKVYGDIKINKDYSERELDQILNNLYSTEFFEDIKINLKNNTLKISLKEYPVVNQLILVGEPSKRFRNEIIKILKTKQNKSFIKSNLSKDIETIKNLYSSNGYNKSVVEVKAKNLDENNIDLVIELDKGNITKISSINFIGDKKIRDRRLRDVIASEENNFWKVISRNTNFSERLVQLDIRLLTNYYKSQGYYDVKITSNSAQFNEKGNIDLIYSIDAGERFIINKISTNADSVFNQNLFFPLKKTFNKYIGDYYSPFSIKQILEELDNLIDKNNLQFVEHNVEEILDDNKIEIKINIFESEKILVERINITGNNVTNEDVIRSELLLDEGDPFTKLGLDKSISKIKARNIFNNVISSVQDGSEKNLKIININVEEKPTGELSAGAGVGTNGGQVAFNISENNWLGQGKKLNFQIELDEESLAGTLNFTDPNYDFLGNSLNYFISSSTNDKPDQGYENKIVNAGINTTFEQFKDIYATLGISASYDDLTTNSSASSSLKEQSGTFNEIAGLYGFKFDGRNRAFMPTSGSVVSFNQSLPLFADRRSVSNTFTMSKYKSINENIVGAGKVYLSAINGIGDDDVRLSKRKNISSKRLRGFERGKVGPVDGNDHIGGNYAAAVNFEASLPNLLPDSSRTEVGLFLDFGNVWGVDYDGDIGDSNKIRSSTGILTSWISPIGPMTFILSSNLSKADTDETQSFNFNLGTTF